MRTLLTAVFLGVFLTGCVPAGPQHAKAKTPKQSLFVNVSTAQGEEVPEAEIYLDGKFIGNPVKGQMQIVLGRGDHKVSVQAPGYATYEKTISIIDLGRNNFQVLNVQLERQ